MTKSMTVLTIALVLIAWSPMATADDGQRHEHSDIEIGLVPGTSTLMVHGDEHIFSGEELIHLEAGDGLLTGLFVADQPGWAAVEEDEPGEIDAIDVESAHQISLQRVSFDDDFLMFQPPGNPIFDGILLFDGDTFQFPQEDPTGTPPETGFHTHTIFAASGDLGDTFSATYRITDPSGIYADSDAFTLSFVIVPEPATCGLMLLGGLALLRRR